MTRPPPLFVLAAPGQGARPLMAALDASPGILALPGLHLAMARRAGDLAAWHARTPRLAETLLRVLPGALDDPDRPTGDLLASLAERAAPRVMAVESHLHLAPAALARLAQAFPKARWLHLTRHPAAQWAAYAATGATGADPGRLWLEPQIIAHEFLFDLDPARRLRLRFEDFAADPAGVTAQLCAWLGVEAPGPVPAPPAGPGPADVPPLDETLRLWARLAGYEEPT